jgi:hypothetical protein
MGAMLRAIIKDFLKGFLFWAVGSALLIYFLKYPGLILSGLLGLIFIASFVALWGAQLLAWLLYFLGIARDRPSSPLAPAVPSQNPNPGSAPNAQGGPCRRCNGTGQMTCSVCHGARGRYERPQTAEGTPQWIPCSYCVGNGTVQCTDCSGTGHVSY